MRDLTTVDREIGYWTERLEQTLRDGREAWAARYDGSVVADHRSYDSRLAVLYSELASLWCERARMTA
jgi:hypothetical protein